ncbi:MAG: tRNA uridine-5-carboxymethylaminomethyl(34) synthesis GTPase MnmE [Fimbriimonadaceae bacterium]
MSLSRHSDTIVAPITAVGGAVAVVRVSGLTAWSVGAAVFSPWPSPVEPHRAVYGRYSHGDDGLALPFAPGRSYTGEESVELSVHGSLASVQALASACIEAGARTAEPGEFTLRAFMNGRMDLTQAEGVRDSVEARTDAQLRQANLLRDGALRDQVRAVREEVVGVLAAVEASTDFSEEVGELDRANALHVCSTVRADLLRLLDAASAARVIREGVSVAIVGLPNAGKSSLLNAVLGSDRAIVTEYPGTTRDTVEECVSLGGLLVRLIDTAGLRPTDDPVESFGVERSRFALENADVVWYVYDASVGWTPADEEAWRTIERPAIGVANKSDLASGDHGIEVSATLGTGIPVLTDVTMGVIGTNEQGALINARHAPLLQEVLCAIDRAAVTLSQPVPDDLAAVDLQAAVRALGEVTGETTPPDIIERIFREFCIGK